jgi:hypothetical protein
MSKRNDLGDRLRHVFWRPVSGDARRLHQAAIDEAVRHHVPPEGMVHTRRRLVAMLLVATLGLLPVGMAVAAESSLPGDPLYPIKRATEAVRSLVDSDITAEHRVAELEELVIRDAAADEIAAQVDRAQAAVDGLQHDNPLRPRFSDVLAAVDDPARRQELREETIAGEDTVTDRPTTTVAVATTSPIASVIDGVTGTSLGVVPPGTIGETTDTVPVVTVPPDPTSTTLRETTTTTVTDTARRVAGYVHAGPTCPVETSPPDPDCEDLAVAGAVLIVRTKEGEEVTRVESADDGRFRLRLVPGAYVLEPQPVDGLLGTAPPQEFVVGSEPIELDVAYDTGIR